jgi:hypothetical protein
MEGFAGKCGEYGGVSGGPQKRVRKLYGQWIVRAISRATATPAESARI